MWQMNLDSNPGTKFHHQTLKSDATQNYCANWFLLINIAQMISVK